MAARWLFVANPTAQSGAAGARIDQAVRCLAANGLRADLVYTLPDGGTTGMVASTLREGRHLGVIAMGGDGTFHEVGNGLLRSGTGLPLGLLPAGTGNNQARSLGIPVDDLEAAARLVAAGELASMDGALFTGLGPEGAIAVWAFDSVSFGFSARALAYRYEDRAEVGEVPILREVYRDELVYAGAVVRALVDGWVEERRFDARVTTRAGTAVHHGLHDLIVNNTTIFARAWVIDPRSRHDDGRMELLPIRGMDEWARHAIVSLDGNPLRSWLEDPGDPRIVQADRFDIELIHAPGERGIPAQVDGEPVMALDRARVRVHRGVLRVLAPSPAPR